MRLLITILLLGTATAAFNWLLTWNHCNWHNFKTSVTICSTVWELILYVVLRLLGVLNSKSKIEYAKTVVEKIEQRRLSKKQRRLDEQRARIVWNATKVLQKCG